MSHTLTRLHELPGTRPGTILSIFVVWLALEFFIFGTYSYVNGYDIGLYASTALTLKWGAGLWYREGVAGFDLAASQHIVPLDFLVYRLLPDFLAYVAYVFIGLGSACWCTYLLLRRQLACSAEASFLGAIMFGTMMAVDYYSYTFNYALIPLVIWMQGVVWRKRLYIALPGVIILSVAYASLSRLVFAMPFLFFATVVWYGLVAPRREIRFWLFMAVFWLVYALSKLPDAWSLLLHLPLSHRPLHPDKSHGIDLALIDTLEYFAGLFSWKYGFGIPLLFAIMVPILARKISPTHLRLLVALAGIPLFVLVVMVAMRTLPLFTESGLSTFSLPRFRFIAVFLVGVGTGLALQQMSKTLNGRAMRALALSFLAAVFCLSIIGKATKLSQWSYTGGFAANYDNPVIHDLAAQVRQEGGRTRIGVYNIFNGSIQSYGLETVGGWYSLLPKRYGQFLDRLNRHDRDQWQKDGVGISKRDFNIALASLANMKYLVSFLPFDHPNLKPLRGPGRSPRELTQLEKASLAMKFNFGLDERYFVYENTAVLPRYFLTKALRSFSDEDRLLASLKSATLAELRNTAFLEGELPETRPNFRTGKVKEVEFEDDRIVLEVEADGPSFLVVTNSYSPFWKARINGREQPIRPTYHALWGLSVPEGRHRIEWTYEPPYKKIAFLDLRWLWSMRWP